MRIKNIFNNITSSYGGVVVNLLLTFIYRTVFINELGVEYLGLSAVYINFLMVLSLGELGITQAISYSLYKPLTKKHTHQIRSLLDFYRKAYKFIGIGILLIGLLFMPFIPFVVSNINDLDNVYLIYLFFLLNSATSYFWGYKRTLINADQKAYKLVPFTAIFQVGDISFRVLLLLLTGNYLLALFSQLIVKQIENVTINKFIDKHYPYILLAPEALPKKQVFLIKKNIKAMIFHKVGDTFVNGTDNIIISMFIGVSALGVYSNYALLISVSFSLLMILFNATSASFGNFIAKESKNKLVESFNVLNFLGLWLFGWASISFYFLVQQFIWLWLGSDFHVSTTIVALLAVNFFIIGIRVPLGIVKSAGGVYSQDKYAPLIQGIINLLLSISLVQVWGVEGVLIGTLLSSLLVPNWYRPYIVYKYLFLCSSRQYFYKVGHFILVLIAAFITTGYLLYLLQSNFVNDFVNFGFDILVCLILPNVIIYRYYMRTHEAIKLRLYFLKAINKGGVCKT